MNELKGKQSLLLGNRLYRIRKAGFRISILIQNLFTKIFIVLPIFVRSLVQSLTNNRQVRKIMIGYNVSSIDLARKDSLSFVFRKKFLIHGYSIHSTWNKLREN